MEAVEVLLDAFGLFDVLSDQMKASKIVTTIVKVSLRRLLSLEQTSMLTGQLRQ